MHDNQLKELALQLREFAKERDWQQFHSPKNLTMALSVEASELLEHFQWLTQEQSRLLDDDKRVEVSEEIADVLIYLVRLADILHIDPMEAVKRKMSLNETKYPVEKARATAVKHTRLFNNPVIDSGTDD
ncbi:MAG: nucleotide pyrophosphohydrolase [Desulfobulbaceae bacterium]|nr:nucleotide pyrophosphohydrolase [Desulfobulbaceae bacterium]